MKKMMMAVMFVLMGSFVWAAESINFINPTQLSNQSWTRTVTVDPLKFSGTPISPVVSFRAEEWLVKPLVLDHNTGLLTATVTSYNQITEFAVYESSTGAGYVEFDNQSSKFYVQAEGKFFVGLVDSDAYTRDLMPAMPLPADTQGDKLVRYGVANGLQTVWCNIASGPLPQDAPFVVTSWQNFAEQDLSAPTSWGWASYTFLKATYIPELRLACGTHRDANKTKEKWLDMSGSTSYYDPALQLAVIMTGTIFVGESINFGTPTLLANKKWSYPITVAPTRDFTGDISSPKIMGDYNQWHWDPLILDPQTGLLTGTIISYNTPTRIVITGNQATDSWFNPVYSQYFSAVDNAVVLGLLDGTVVKKTAMPSQPMPPGSQGDSLVRWSKTAPDRLNLWLNFNSYFQNLDSPFILAKRKLWQRDALVFADSWGWLTIEISPLNFGSELQFVAGGSWANSNWLDLSSSLYWDSALKLEKIQFESTALEVKSAVRQTDGRYLVGVLFNRLSAGQLYRYDAGNWLLEPLTINIAKAEVNLLTDAQVRWIVGVDPNAMKEYLTDSSKGQVIGDCNIRLLAGNVGDNDFIDWAISKKGWQVYDFDFSTSPPTFTPVVSKGWVATGAVQLSHFGLVCR